MSDIGQMKSAPFFSNKEGLNLSDSPFMVSDGQATGGYNYNYTQTGGIRKRSGHSKINSVANASLISLGLGTHITAVGVKTLIRAAGTALQKLDTSTPSFTALTEDTLAAGSAFLTSGSTVPVVWSQFNNANANTLWGAGGGMSSIYGVYSSSKATLNGAAVPTGTISASAGGSGGSFTSIGTYFYAVGLRKASTLAVSNAALDTSATVASVTQTVTVNLASLGAIDTTKYDQIWIYRSAVGGVTAFTTGDIIAKIASTLTTYADVGTYISTAQNIPRASSLILDNSVLGSGTYKTLATYKRRLVTASNSTLYFSDQDKPESWPVVNTITIPSGGPITGLAVLGFNNPSAATIDEILVVFKEREIWVVTGSSYSDWALKFIDATGCPNQSLIVVANGHLYWIDYRGVYMWDGSAKPVYCSRLIEPLFAADGDLDKTKLAQGVGSFKRKSSEIVWALSHKVFGTQMFELRLDLRLTNSSGDSELDNRNIEAIFTQDSTPFGTYAVLSYLPSDSSDEAMLLGDDSGFVYMGYNAGSDGGTGVNFSYLTKFLDMGSPAIAKRYHKVIVWVEEVGNWNLTLDYWADYNASLATKATVAQPISTAPSTLAALWDVANWDEANWDDYTARLKPLVFNLNSGVNNNNEGDSLRLQFRQSDADAPVTIAGFTIIYTEIGMRK